MSSQNTLFRMSPAKMFNQMSTWKINFQIQMSVLYVNTNLKLQMLNQNVKYKWEYRYQIIIKNLRVRLSQKKAQKCKGVHYIDRKVSYLECEFKQDC